MFEELNGLSVHNVDVVDCMNTKVLLLSVKWLQKYQQIILLNGVSCEHLFDTFWQVGYVKAYQIYCLFIFISMYLWSE